MDRLWEDLAAKDPAVGYRAIAAFGVEPTQAAKELARRLQRVEPVKAEILDRLIGDLDDPSFAVRERASARLAELGEAARLPLEKALAGKPSSEVRGRAEKLLEKLGGPFTPRQLQSLRAVEVLEYVGTAQAKRVLEHLAGGAAGARETEDARAALQRLERRTASDK